MMYKIYVYVKIKARRWQMKTYALVEIEKLLYINDCTLQNFWEELCPNSLSIRDIMNKLIAKEMQYDNKEMHVEQE